MRIEEQIEIAAPPQEVWDVVTDPSVYLRLVTGVTRWEVQGEQDRGLGARYQMRMQVGSAQIGGLIEMVEWDDPRDLAWTSLTGIDQRGRWRVRETDDGGSRVTFRLQYSAPGGLLGTLTDRLSAPVVQGNLRSSLERLKAELEGGFVSADGKGIVGSVAHQINTIRVLIDAGIVRPIRPDKLARVGLAMARWGRTPAAGYIASAIRFPNESALIDEVGTLTFAQLHENTNRLANSLADAGIREGDGIAIMARNHRGWVYATVAAAKLGAHALHLNTAFAGPQITEVTEREGPLAVIYDEEFADLIADAGRDRKRFIAWHDTDALADQTLDKLIEAGSPADPAPPDEPGRTVILTSGTTGTPKGANRASPDSLDPAAALLGKIPLRSRGTAHITAPLFHSWGFAHFTLGLLLSSTLVLRRQFDPEATLADIEKHRCDSVALVPVMLQRIMELPEETRKKHDLSSVRAVCMSGSALPGDLALDFMNVHGDTIFNLYGSTEVAWATIATPEDLRAAPGTAGRPPTGTILRLYDDNGAEVTTGETGRIFVGNEMLFEGYTGGGSKDLIDGLMATGDVGRMDDGGRLFVEGRDDEMIVSGGENLFPAEVEDLLAKHPAVGEAAAIGVDDEQFGQRLKAFVVPASGSDPSEDELKGYVKENLARFKVPRQIEFLDELPRNATGKVLKRELREREAEGAEAG